MARRGVTGAIRMGGLALAGALVAASPAVAREKAASTSAAPHDRKAAKKPAKAAKSPTLVPADEELVHVVGPGETLGGIANRAKVPRVLIIEANGLKKPYAVRQGQRLKLPRTRHHTVREGETGFDIAYKYGVPFHDIAVANGISAKDILKPGRKLLIPTVLGAPTAIASSKTGPAKTEAGKASPDKAAAGPVPSARASTASEPKPVASARFLWPVAGKVRRGFAPRTSDDPHDGLDIVADAGTPVRATAAGTVIFAGHEPQSFGNLVVVQHDGGWQSAYGYLGAITVERGAHVRQNERVGLVGHTGRATRDELHFELRLDNRPVDPADRLAQPGRKPDAKPTGSPAKSTGSSRKSAEKQG